uniref:Retrotransposon gag domain-containing protein n=1 Tax=Oryza brachyantha TaxID=4533 RepID=J3KVC6_ORYBR
MELFLRTNGYVIIIVFSCTLAGPRQMADLPKTHRGQGMDHFMAELSRMAITAWYPYDPEYTAIHRLSGEFPHMLLVWSRRLPDYRGQPEPGGARLRLTARKRTRAPPRVEEAYSSPSNPLPPMQYPSSPNPSQQSGAASSPRVAGNANGAGATGWVTVLSSSPRAGVLKEVKLENSQSHSEDEGGEGEPAMVNIRQGNRDTEESETTQMHRRSNTTTPAAAGEPHPCSSCGQPNLDDQPDGTTDEAAYSDDAADGQPAVVAAAKSTEWSTLGAVQEKVAFATHQLMGPASTWWDNFLVTRTATTEVTWAEFCLNFHKAHIPSGILTQKKREFCALQQGNRLVTEYLHEFNRLARYVPEVSALMLREIIGAWSIKHSSSMHGASEEPLPDSAGRGEGGFDAVETSDTTGHLLVGGVAKKEMGFGSPKDGFTRGVQYGAPYHAPIRFLPANKGYQEERRQRLQGSRTYVVM